MNFLPQDLDDYIVAHSDNEPTILAQLWRESHLKVINPRMLSGPYQGRLLSMISKLIQPKRILEIGTFTGYSGICLAEGLPDDGELITIDINEELEDLAKKYFDRFGKSTSKNIQITQKIGNAIEIIPTLEGKFDLIFIDADKPNYVHYFHQVINKLNPGGLLLSDNVLWSGKVVQPLDDQDVSTKILLEYNKVLKEDDRLETVLLGIRDGLTLSRKRN